MRFIIRREDNKNRSDLYMEFTNTYDDYDSVVDELKDRGGGWIHNDRGEAVEYIKPTSGE